MSFGLCKAEREDRLTCLPPGGIGDRRTLHAKLFLPLARKVADPNWLSRKKLHRAQGLGAKFPAPRGN
jgi:hypothetical protein